MVLYIIDDEEACEQKFTCDIILILPSTSLVSALYTQSKKTKHNKSFIESSFVMVSIVLTLVMNMNEYMSCFVAKTKHKNKNRPESPL